MKLRLPGGLSKLRRLDSMALNKYINGGSVMAYFKATLKPSVIPHPIPIP